ncbi:response regulator [Flaviaesturariibacter amylovorans]|uniref:Response regulatory domain-containing protein n=1 Tax=Flaviaesturariibacter amylovorans TaxID=1084520 RepID=A0ABP8H5B1_9BACT
MTKSLPPKSLVLYADDDLDDLEMMRDILRPYNNFIELVSFTNGFALWSYVSTWDDNHSKPCLIILDVNMPLMDGKQTLRKIRASEITKDIPVVLFTTSTMPHEAEFAKAHQAGFITKPISTQHVSMIAEEILAHCGDELKQRIKGNLGY